MLVDMEITSLITFLRHFKRWLSTVHWMLARDKRRFGHQELIWWWYVHQDFNRQSWAPSDIVSKFNHCNIPRTFIPSHLASTVLELITDYQQLDLWYKYASLFISFPYTHAEAQSYEDVILYVLQLTRHLLTFDNLCFMSNLTQPHWWLQLGTAVQSVMVTIWKVFHF